MEHRNLSNGGLGMKDTKFDFEKHGEWREIFSRYGKENLKKLILKLYKKETPLYIKLSLRKEGRSGVAVAIANWKRRDGMWMTPFVIKIGSPKKINKEYKNYKSFIKGTVIETSSTQISKPVFLKNNEGQEVSAIFYNFVGRSLKLVDFSKYLADNTEDCVLSLLNRLFRNLLYTPLYSKRVKWSDPKKFGELIKPNPKCFSRLKQKNYNIQNFEIIFDQYDTVSSPKKLVPVHGDLRSANILIDSETHSEYLIDFGKTGWGHILQDCVWLECDVAYRLIKDTISENQEESLLLGLPLTEGDVKVLKISKIIREIRKIAESLLPSIEFNWNDYYLLRLATSLYILSWDDPDFTQEAKRRIEFFIEWVSQYLTKNKIEQKTFSKLTNIRESIQRAGITNIYYHGQSEERNKRKSEVIQNEKGELFLLANTGHSYLDRELNRFYESVVNRLKNKDKQIGPMKIILLNPYSEEAMKIGLREHEFFVGAEYTLEFHKNTRLFQRFQICIKEYEELKARYPDRINLRIAPYSIDATLLISGESAFMEPYIIGNLQQRFEKGKFMNVPEIEYRKYENIGMYKTLMDHFNFFWDRGITVDEFRAKERQFIQEFKNRTINYSLVAQHDSWISLDPIVRCSQNCQYCYLKPYNLNNQKPHIMIRDQDDICNNLLCFPYYRRNSPVAIGNYTDMFHPDNVKFLINLLKRFKDKNIPNPICLVTKRQIPNEVLKQIGEIGLDNIIIFISCSFMPNEIEPGVDYKKLLSNFTNIRNVNKSIEKKIKCFHFWRPVLWKNVDSENTARKVITRLIEVGSPGSVVIGLKLNPFLRNLMRSRRNPLYTEFMRPERNNYLNMDEVLPDECKNHILTAVKSEKSLSGYPIFFHTSCAVSYLLRQPDYNATFIKEKYGICKESNCPNDMRQICSNSRFAKRSSHDLMTEMGNLLRKFGYSSLNFELDDPTNPQRIDIDGEIPQDFQIYLTQSLVFPVKVKIIRQTMQWTGSISRFSEV